MPAIRVPSRNKFGVSERDKRTYNGVVYASKAEATYAAQLDLMVRAKKIHGWARQVPMTLTVNGAHIGTHYIDFAIQETPDGPIKYVEIKGYETPDYKLKKKLLLALYPHINYEVIRAK